MSNTVFDFLEERRRIHGHAEPAPWNYHDFGHSGDPEPSTIVIFKGGKFVWRDVYEGELIVATPQWDRGDQDNVDAIVDAHNKMPMLLDALQAVLDMCEQADGPLNADDIHAAIEEVLTRANPSEA